MTPLDAVRLLCGVALMAATVAMVGASRERRTDTTSAAATWGAAVAVGALALALLVWWSQP